MSIDDVNIRRENILRLVRKSASTDYNSDSLRGPDDYPEHRITFLERRKQFEQPPPPVDEKPPFLPHWINPGYDTDVSITYKKRGTEITDLRINYVNDNDGSNNKMGTTRSDKVSSDSHTESSRPVVRAEPRDLGNQGLILNERCKRGGLLYSQNANVKFLANREKTVSSGIAEASYLLNENLTGSSDKRGDRPIDRRGSSAISTRQFQNLRIIEERSSSMLSKTITNSESNRMVDSPRKIQNILPNYSTHRKATICRPIIRKPIELKKYDHIVTNVISNKKK